MEQQETDDSNQISPSDSSKDAGKTLEMPFHGMTQSSRTGNAAHQMTPLSKNFSPGYDDVICGRGKKCYNHIGNERFRQRVHTMLDDYANAKSKIDKSAVLSRLMSAVRRSSPNGGFVKQNEAGLWFEVGDFLAREKTSQAFRDALHERYKSSNSSKRRRRQQVQARDKAQKTTKSKLDLSSIGRLSNEVMLGEGINAGYGNHKHQKLDIASRLRNLPNGPLQGQFHYPDPLLGGYSSTTTFGGMANASFVGGDMSSSSLDLSSLPQERSSSLPDHRLTAAAGLDIEAMHNSLPNIPFQMNPNATAMASFSHAGAQEFDVEMYGMNRSLPNLSYTHDSRHYVDPLRMHSSSFIETNTRVMQVGEMAQSTTNLAPDLKRSSSWPKLQSAVAGESSQGKDFLSCLEKMTEHSISDGNPFEPIPIPVHEDKKVGPSVVPSSMQNKDYSDVFEA